ncbi:sulfite exporter TauE/SafE family protein [Lacticaseibacillus porcinae]|uniref:sulfite exporter TauE/SafE family protein n=1 Tax=Lacticaseibacillus porcinae TaxID=1123687 RepID=UPI000F77F799|nr:sulfite exporter TauE/SafE family protein [Lacticaseibacillus porcinae]
MGVSLLYALVIVVANSFGAVSGMGGGVLIKPMLDTIGADSVAAISFYATVAVFTMSVVTTGKQLQHGVKLSFNMLLWIASGAVIGGVIGKALLSWSLSMWSEHMVLAAQIILTILTILFAFLNTRFNWRSFGLNGWYWQLGCGLVLGFFASFLGIGGGPINVALLMLLFGMPIKLATVYSLATIFCSQGAKLIAIIIAGDNLQFDLQRLWFIIPAAIVGGFVGAKLSQVLSSEKVTIVFQLMLLVVILINGYNGVQLLMHW